MWKPIQSWNSSIQHLLKQAKVRVLGQLIRGLARRLGI